MTKVNSTISTLSVMFLLPTMGIIILINATAIVLFRSLEPNFVYKMIIYDSISNIVFAILSFYGKTYWPRLPFAPLCGVFVACKYGLGAFNRLVPLSIVLYRYSAYA